jgi:hypothetical protein
LIGTGNHDISWEKIKGGSMKPKGQWIHRFSIRLFTLFLAVLVYWVLGFLVQDIESIPGPSYDEIEQRHVDPALVDKQKALAADMADADRAIAGKREEMQIISDSTRNLQSTISQLIELQKLTVQKSAALPETEQANLSESLARFLDNQTRYQTLNTELSGLTDQKQALAAEKRQVDERIRQLQKPAREEFQHLTEKHRLRLAVYQLFILIPLLAIGAFLLIKKRGSLYYPLFLGFGAAVLVKVSLVLHAYFPSRYLKYVLVAGLLVVVVRLLVYFIRAVAFPKTRWLIRQYRDAYERFLCPVCEYPIRTGPRKYLFWTRRTINKLVVPGEPEHEKPYACPACGTVLFEECGSCGGIRHALLPHCQHCNAHKELTENTESGSPAV